MVSVLVSLPITLRYLGVQRFSVWVTITSLTALLSFADFGLGNGLMNAVARCDAKGDDQSMREYVSSAFFALVALAGIGVCFAFLVVPLLPWATFLAVDRNRVSPRELAEIMIVFSICISIGIPAAVVQKVQLALQFGYLASLWQLVASFAAMLALLGAVSMRLSLAWLVAAWLATPTLVLSVGSLVFWRYQRTKSSPSIFAFSARHLRELMHSGLLFFVIQLAGTVAFSSDALILAHILGPAAVAQYSVASKLFDGVYMVSALFLTPLWPAYAEAHARGDLSWVRRTLKMSLTTTAAVSFAISIILVSTGRLITHVWVGDQVKYSMMLFVLCGLWAIIRTTGNSLAMFMNGIGWIGFQAILSIPFAALAVIAKVMITQRIGIIGIPVALIAAYVLALALPYGIRIPIFLSKPSR